ncbi:MAG: hypothetical protein GY856_23560, partial [bacterium]|nr:hypothetical protein [bacterium]
MPLDDRPQERRNAAARLVTWLDAGVDPAAGALAVVRLRVVRSTTLVMLVLALPVAVRCWMLGRGAAAVAGLAAAAAWLVLLLVPHPWRRPVVAGRLAAAILFAALLAPALAASGAPGPVRLECGAVAALVLLGLRGGGVWTALAALATLGLGARAGASPEELAAGIFLLLATVAPVAILVACAERMGQALTAEVRARRDSEHRARAADRAKSEFLTNMSHELRTPISGVLGIADLLRKAELPERERRRLEILNTSAETLLALVDDILDLSRIEAGRLAIREIDFRPRALLEELVRMFEPRAADKGLALRLELA